MISLSPSGVSNGARLISAIAATRNRIIPSGWKSAPHPGSQPKTSVPSAEPPVRIAERSSASEGPCCATMDSSRSVPNRMNVPTSVRPSVTSYETSWAEARRPPRSASLLLEVHPASAVPNTASDASAST